MGDLWDYRLRKMEIAWELTKRTIPDEPASGGAWTEDNYLDKAQQVLKKAYAAVDAVFKEA